MASDINQLAEDTYQWLKPSLWKSQNGDNLTGSDKARSLKWRRIFMCRKRIRVGKSCHRKSKEISELKHKLIWRKWKVNIPSKMSGKSTEEGGWWWLKKIKILKKSGNLECDNVCSMMIYLLILMPSLGQWHFSNIQECAWSNLNTDDHSLMTTLMNWSRCRDD